MTEQNSVSPWLWRATVGTLALVILVGLMSALWLGTRPLVTGTPISSRELGAWTFSSSASGSETDGALTLQTSEADRVAYAVNELSLANFTVQARATFISGPDDASYGLVVRYQRPDDFITLLIGPDGYIAVGQMSGGVWQWRVPWQQWPHIKRGTAENLLRAQCGADRCRFYVNDEFAFEASDVPARGKMGPAVWNPAKGASVSAVFREWRVWK
jgi:hypothetical protein